MKMVCNCDAEPIKEQISENFIRINCPRCDDEYEIYLR